MFYLKSSLTIVVGFAASFVLPAALDTISLQYDVSESTFESFKDPATLRKFVHQQGYVLPLPYRAFSQDVSNVLNAVESGSLSYPPVPPVQGEDDRIGFRPFDSSPITTYTNSTTLKGGPSYTNVTVEVQPMHISGICFTDGNSGSSGGSIQRVTTASSDCSSGRANSTDHVTGNQSKIRINVSAVVNGAKAKEVINGGRDDGLLATACAADADGASAEAFLRTVLSFPVNQEGKRRNMTTGNAFCQAGVSQLSDPNRANDGGATKKMPSSSKSVSALGGMGAAVVCNGQMFSANQGMQTDYSVQIKGMKKKGQKFKGRFKVIRTASVKASCS